MKRNFKSLMKLFLFLFPTILVLVSVFKFFKWTNESLSPYTTLTSALADNKSQIEFLPIKIDWHDWHQIHLEKLRTGIGEHGARAKISLSEAKTKYDTLYKVNGFNALLSDSISLNRSIPDIRHELCKSKKYRYKLPTVSVIVPFHNEHFSVLLRTVYSVLNRSPKSLLGEIILVDDFSTKVHCKGPLDEFVSINFKEKVQVIHLKKREGLIRARLAGAKIATNEVLIFLDSHTEANVNWLPPLLEPITEDYRTCVCPFIDVIDYETFEYRAQDEGARGAFDWEFFYKRLPLLPDDLLNPTKPFRSPVMAGGLFAISARWFWELGGYDPGLDIWGGEQYELSFKIWQCGGMIVDAPCSRVGHIYRKFAPFPNPGIGDFIGKNYRRVVEVWMDEYGEYIYKRKPNYRNIYPGDLTEQKKIREKLKCKSFKWFIKEIAFDLVEKYPFIEPPNIGHGKIRSLNAPELCLDSTSEDKLKLKDCSDNDDQTFLLSWRKDIRKKNNMCLDVSDPSIRGQVGFYKCHSSGGNQLWRYDHIRKMLVHGTNHRCLESDISTRKVYVTHCQIDNDDQKWIIEHINSNATNWTLNP
ncbi:N-acetylgalactosaminyltransferase 6-like isoform X2 [Daktulosphaira vitifoliae]|uniref:N-acetylgalactosaminyltransferase 6-like isoform X2 n=1 Tax=Daktulosphaira vitifoliae TaxID=58002 RepID=UPI0021A9982D|nr:N-acetylgalactosaminyltransferase 6-like isoform X2 [Daktulosphaira vitifoliae]